MTTRIGTAIALRMYLRMNHALAKGAMQCCVKDQNSDNQSKLRPKPTVQVKRSERQAAGNRKYGIGNMRLVSWRCAAPPTTNVRVPSPSRQRCVGRCSSADIVESEAGLWFSVSAFQTAAGLKSSLIAASLRRWVRLVTTAAQRWRCGDGRQRGRG